MKNTRKKSNIEISPELEALFDNARPIEELDIKGLAQSFEELEQSPDFVADSTKGVFVEDVLRALDEKQVTKSELARSLGKTRQQLSAMLNEEKLNNFTIETMAQISTALGRKLFVRMLAPEESVEIQTNTIEQAALRIKLRDLFSQDWSPPTPGLNLAELKKAKQAADGLDASHDNIILFNHAA